MGNSFPGTKCLSTPFSVMTANRIHPPEELSLDMARATAVDGEMKRVRVDLHLNAPPRSRLFFAALSSCTLFSKIQSLVLGHILLVSCIAVAVNVGRSRTANSKGLFV